MHDLSKSKGRDVYVNLRTVQFTRDRPGGSRCSCMQYAYQSLFLALDPAEESSCSSSSLTSNLTYSTQARVFANPGNPLDPLINFVNDDDQRKVLKTLVTEAEPVILELITRNSTMVGFQCINAPTRCGTCQCRRWPQDHERHPLENPFWQWPKLKRNACQ